MPGYLDTIREIFEASGFDLATSHSHKYDFDADNTTNSYAVAVKKTKNLRISAFTLEHTVYDLKKAAESEYRTPLLVVLGELSPEHRKLLSPDGTLVILDICNLLYMIREHSDLKTELLAQLEYSVDFLIPQQPDISIKEVILLGSADDPDYERTDQGKEQQWIDGMLTLLSDWDPEESGSVAYETICTGILKKLFADDLALWCEQRKANDGLFRFDLICKIKNGNEKEFWKMAERYFDSKYIVFEFKNYQEQIGQREVFTTVKYLYKKALRGVAILISANGADKHAAAAIRGILRDEGKLILALTNKDLIEMLKIKKRRDDPADYLSEKLDALLIELEK
jgi:hypothetical protein